MAMCARGATASSGIRSTRRSAVQAVGDRCLNRASSRSAFWRVPCWVKLTLAAQAVGDRCFEEGLFEPARAVFAHIPAWGRLASTLVRLHQFQAAVDAARKANSPKTWKEVRAPGPLCCM